MDFLTARCADPVCEENVLSLGHPSCYMIFVQKKEFCASFLLSNKKDIHIRTSCCTFR